MRTSLARFSAVLCILGLAACEPTTAPQLGAIRVVASTTGLDLDLDGYGFRVNGTSHPSQVQPNGSFIVGGLRPGSISVQLTGLAANCVLSSPVAVTVTVIASDTVDASFAAECAANIGTISVSSSTTGVDFDTDNYLVSLDGGAPVALGGGGVAFDSVPVGSHSLVLSGIAGNCVALAPTRTAVVQFNKPTFVQYPVQCAARVGQLQLYITTTGVEADDAYEVEIGDLDNRVVSANGVVTINGLREGDRIVTLNGVRPNCTVTGSNSRPVTIAYAQVTQLNFEVTCVAAARLRVTTVTTGEDIDQAYQVRVTGTSSERLETLPAQGTTTILDLGVGSHTVTLEGVAPNCGVSTSPNPRTVTLASGSTTDVAFDVICVQAPKVRVTMTTTGVDNDQTYRVRITGAAVDLVETLPAQGAVTISQLGVGSHTVTLDDVAVNCDVAPSTPNPRIVTLMASSTTDVAFDVACTLAPQVAFARYMSGGLELFSAKANGMDETRLTTNSAAEQDPMYSPDGTRLVFWSDRDGNHEIYVMNADGSAPVRLTNNTAVDVDPEWSPSGSRIAFRSSRDGNDEIYVMNADGSNVTRLTDHAAFDSKPTWSPDGSRIAFMSTRSGSAQIWVMNADGSNVTRLTKSTDSADLPSWSPDGTKIAFVRDVACDDYYYSCHNIHVMNADGTGEVRHETRSHDSQPAWSPDGRWIAFETRYCTYYSCDSYSLSAVKADLTGRTVMVAGDLLNPAWRP